MISIEQFQDIACEIADEIPQEFFHKLNGGIVLLEQAKLHADSVPSAPLYVMGEYTSSRMMGQSIQLYYGSFAQTYGSISDEALRSEIRKVILHEFRHHMEWRSGTHELADDDRVKMAEYNAAHRGGK